MRHGLWCAPYDLGLMTNDSQKLDAMKELAYGASHEVNNPLANIAARAQALLRDETQPDRQRALEAIHQQAMRAHEMISDLMLFARPPALVLETVNLSTLLGTVAQQLGAECERRNVRLLLQQPDTSLSISADPQQLQVALVALCTNSLEAIGTDGTIELTLRPAQPTGEMVTIEVLDTGPGIPADVRRHMFDPFYSGREAGRGLGFGLSKAWRIISDHGGTISVTSASGEGTTFTLELPQQARTTTD